MADEKPNGGQDNNQNANGNGNQNVGFEQLMTAADTAWKEYDTNPTPENKEKYVKAQNVARETLVKTQAELKAKNTAPDKFDLKIPEKAIISQDHVERIAAFAKEHGLTNDKAQAILERDNQLLAEDRARMLKEQETSMSKMQEGWLTTAKADKEFGGEQFDKNIELARRVLGKYGTPEFNAILTDPKQGMFGNHPELVRVLVRIGKAMGEDSFVNPGANGGNKNSESFADKFYGKK